MNHLADRFCNGESIFSYDLDPTPKASSALDSLCALTKGVVVSGPKYDFVIAFSIIVSIFQQSKYGHELKQRFITAAFLDAAMKYLLEHCPPLFKIGLT